MARWPLLGGSYMAQGIIANAQRCINLYPEINPKDSPVPITHYETPGLLQKSSGLGFGRGLYTTSQGELFGVSGTVVWWRSAAGVETTLGSIPLLLTPVRWVDNGYTLILLDGTETGAWQVDLSTKVFSVFEDPTDLFGNAFMGAYLDTFTVFNVRGTRRFVSSLSNSMVFDALYYAEKTGNPDPLVGVIVVHRELWLIGEKSSEIWTTTGGEDFPFTILPGAFIQYGCGAPYSLVSADVSVFWLGQNDQGQGMVLRGRGYTVERISTHALEQEIQKYPSISDAQGYTYQENGHIFYVLTFPSASKTWAYDESTNMWHQRAWMDSDGKLFRHRVNSSASAYGILWGQDWENGKLYEMSSKYYTDDGASVVRVRSFPHLPRMEAGGKVVSLEGKRIKYDKFMADIEVGNMPETSQNPEFAAQDVLLGYDDPVDSGSLLADDDADDFGILLDDRVLGPPGPRVMLRWSNTRGASWQGTLTNTLGSSGEYYTMPSWRRLGYARDRVWELSWTAPCKTALNGAWVELRMMKS